MAVVEVWAALADPPLELCGEALSLCGALLASPEPAHQDAAVGMVERTLRRWGPYMRDTLDPRVGRQVGAQRSARQEYGMCVTVLVCMNSGGWRVTGWVSASDLLATAAQALLPTHNSPLHVHCWLAATALTCTHADPPPSSLLTAGCGPGV